MMSGCAVTINRHSKKPDLFSLEVDVLLERRNILICVCGEMVYFADEKDEQMRYTATPLGDSSEPAIIYDTFDEWPPSSFTSGKPMLLLAGLSFMSIQHIVESRRVAAAVRQNRGETVLFSELMQKQLDSLAKEIAMKK